MEQTFTSHLFSQALSSKEQRLAFKAPEALTPNPESAPKAPEVNPSQEKDTRIDDLKGALTDHAKGVGALLTFPLTGSYGVGASSFYHGRGLYRSGKAAIDTVRRAFKGDAPEKKPEAQAPVDRPVIPVPTPTKPTPKPTPSGPEAPQPAPAPAPAPESPKPAPTPAPTEPQKPNDVPGQKPEHATPKPENKPETTPELSIEEYKSEIEGLNKEKDPKKFQEKLDALNKKIDEKMQDKKPEEKAKLLDKVKTEIKNEKFKVKVEQKLVIVDEQKTPDVKPPALDQKESMQSFVKDIIEAIKTLMKEFGLTKEDLKGIITNKPNAPTAPTAGLNAGNATAEQLTQAKMADAQRLAELEKRVKSLETDKNTPRGRAERIPNLDKQALEREVRDRLEQRRLDRELKRRLEIERHGQEFADRTSREGQRYGIGAQVTLDRAGIRMYSVNDRGASTLRTIEQMAPQTLPGRLVHANDGSLIVPFIYAPRNSGNINVGGIQQNFEPSLASAYEKASSATPPSAPAPRVETPPAPKPPMARRPSTSGSLE